MNIHVSRCLKEELTLSYTKKREKPGCGICERTRFKFLKEELGWAIDKWSPLIINKMLFKLLYTYQ